MTLVSAQQILENLVRSCVLATWSRDSCCHNKEPELPNIYGHLEKCEKCHAIITVLRKVSHESTA